MVDEQAPPGRPSADEQSPSRRAQITRIAGSIVGTVRTLSLASLAAGLWIWALLFYPFAFRGWGTATLGAGTLLLLLAPGGVLLIFHLGLRQVVSLPSRLGGLAADGRERSREVVETLRAKDDQDPQKRRAWQVFLATWSLRGLFMEGTDAVLQSVAVARLVNPVALVTVMLASAAGILLVVLAILGTVASLIL